MIHSATRLLKSGVRLALGKLGYGLVKLPKDESTNLATRKIEPAPAEVPRTEPLVRTISDFSTSPVELYLRKHYEMFRTGHFDYLYPEWRVRRIRKVIDLYGTDFKGKHIVELGGGHGDIGAFFAELGAQVLSVEGRKENVDFANIKYHHIPTFKSVQRNLENDFSDLGRFDLVISFGSLEVIHNVHGYLNSTSALSRDIFFETIVLDAPNADASAHENFDNIDSLTNDHTLSGRTTHVTPAFIEASFARHGFVADRRRDPDLNCYTHCYDWTDSENRTGVTTRAFWRFTGMNKLGQPHRD